MAAITREELPGPTLAEAVVRNASMPAVTLLGTLAFPLVILVGFAIGVLVKVLVVGLGGLVNWNAPATETHTILSYVLVIPFTTLMWVTVGAFQNDLVDSALKGIVLGIALALSYAAIDAVASRIRLVFD